jgi:hypothetical protein
MSPSVRGPIGQETDCAAELVSQSSFAKSVAIYCTDSSHDLKPCTMNFKSVLRLMPVWVWNLVFHTEGRR